MLAFLIKAISLINNICWDSFLLIPAGRKFWFNDDRRQKFKDKTCLWLKPLRQRNQDLMNIY